MVYQRPKRNPLRFKSSSPESTLATRKSGQCGVTPAVFGETFLGQKSSHSHPPPVSAHRRGRLSHSNQVRTMVLKALLTVLAAPTVTSMSELETSAHPQAMWRGTRLSRLP